MKERGRFKVPALPVSLAGSARMRPGDHVVGRLPTNYSILPKGHAAIDTVAARLGHKNVSDLRRAVMLAHDTGVRKIVEFNDNDLATRATAALRALRALSSLVDDPTFIPAIRFATPIAVIENRAFGKHAKDLARGLDHVALLEQVVADAQRRVKRVKRKNPGKPYMAGLVESLVTSWREWTGELPSKTRPWAKRSRSRRVLFWEFLDGALVDLRLQDRPVDHHVRAVITHLQKAARRPRK